MSGQTIKMVSILSAAFLLTAACVEGTEPSGPAADPVSISADLGLNILHFDPNERPQDDFYRWVNGRWLVAVLLTGLSPVPTLSWRGCCRGPKRLQYPSLRLPSETVAGSRFHGGGCWRRLVAGTKRKSC